jgi:hypothetical protein
MEKHHRNYDLNFFFNLWKIQKALTDVDVNEIALTCCRTDLSLFDLPCNSNMY